MVRAWRPGAAAATLGGRPMRLIHDAGVFEAMTRALATNPGALQDLSRLVERLQATPEGRSTFPEGFHQLWESVNTARKTVGAHR